MVRERQRRLGGDAVKVGWMKEYIGIFENKEAGKKAKEGARQEAKEIWITEGGSKQAWASERKMKEQSKAWTLEGSLNDPSED